MLYRFGIPMTKETVILGTKVVYYQIDIWCYDLLATRLPGRPA
jgi:hypothetical protein